MIDRPRKTQLTGLREMPAAYYVVEEGEYGSAPFDETSAASMIMTLGLISCKGVTVYDPVDRMGAVAHIDAQQFQRAAVSELAAALGHERIRRSHVHIVNAVSGLGATMPTDTQIAELFRQYKPGSVTIVPGVQAKRGRPDPTYERHIGLDLATGAVHDVMPGVLMEKISHVGAIGIGTLIGQNQYAMIDRTGNR